MIRTNNKEVINRLSKNSFKYNKGRNKFAIVSIILTTLLFTAFFTIQMSMIKSTQYESMRMVGGTFHGGFKNLNTKEYEKIKDNKLIKEKGISIFVNLAQNKELAKRQTEIKYGDKNYIENCFAKPFKGDIPKNKNEILVDTLTLDALGIPKGINQKINLKYFIEGKEYNTEFKISGIYKGDKVSMASILYVSKDFVEEELKGVDQEKSKKSGEGTGLISLEVNFSNSFFIEEKLEKVLIESGLNTKKINNGVNWAYTSVNLEENRGAVFGAIGFLAIIMFAGYLIIYNVFYISIVKDIKFYGLLKTIGTTKKQINKIIIKQALKMCTIGIPIGVALGYFIGAILTPLVIGQTTIVNAEISASPIIFIGSILFSLITVLISIHKPSKIASKVSPIEALRYSGVREKTRKKFKKTNSGAKIKNMALSNVFKNKRKSFIVIASLSLSIILLNVVYTIIYGLDMDKYLVNLIGTDFTVGDTSFYRWEYGFGNYSDALTEDICKEIENLDGVDSVDKIYNKGIDLPLIDEMKKNIELKKSSVEQEDQNYINKVLKDKKIPTECYGIDEGILPFIEKYLTKGKIDIEKFKSGNYIILDENWYMGRLLDVGSKVTIPFENGQSKEYEVMATVQVIPLYLRTGCVNAVGNDMYLPINEFKNIANNKSVMTAMFNVDDSQINNVKNYLDNKIKTNPTLDNKMKLTYINAFEDMANTYKIVGYGLSFVLGLIGILNFNNVMMTNIISRKREFAILKGVGMTENQLKKLVKLEGLYYALLTIFIVVVIGLPLTKKLVTLVAGGMMIFSYKFTMLPIIISSPILIIISIIVPAICIKYTEKNSIVEALRENE
ncbi:ABC transporter permease [Romboutsia lituseburensis]|uniref:ABC transporter permease n=1 Tax=Romboutsia lituseburensis TaxID=1537 RepID=UPI00215AD7EE|nr:ABC transporter permease [Romboutsia lituseburensis]MCR8746864.1 ABC transporter permease [Romboutsia lituseburensis]